jgi:hypothetical protein
MSAKALDGGQEVVHIFLQAANRPGSGPAQGDQALDARFAHTYQCKFRGHKEAVRQNEQGDGNYSKEHQLDHFARQPSVRSVLYTT